MVVFIVTKPEVLIMTQEISNEEISNMVKAAMESKGVTGIIKLSDHAGISRPKASKVFRGVKEAKFGDYVTALHSLGYDIKFVKRTV